MFFIGLSSLLLKGLHLISEFETLRATMLDPIPPDGQPVSHWLEEAKKPDPKARKRAVKELGRVGKADPAMAPGGEF
jgi:hypothetical protein